MRNEISVTNNNKLYVFSCSNMDEKLVAALCSNLDGSRRSDLYIIFLNCKHVLVKFSMNYATTLNMNYFCNLLIILVKT